MDNAAGMTTKHNVHNHVTHEFIHTQSEANICTLSIRPPHPFYKPAAALSFTCEPAPET